MSNLAINDETAVCIIACAAAINQQLYQLIDLLNEQTRVLKRLLGKPPRPSNDERRSLAVRAHDLERDVLEAQELIVTVDTFRRWHKRLIAATYTAKRRGRPPISRETELIIVRLARENPHWGEDSIRDRMGELGYDLSDRTISNVLRRHGIPPAPQRRSTNDWQRLLMAHWPHIAAIDFATFEVPNNHGRTTRHHALYAIRLATRELRLIGVNDHADGDWMTNMARSMTDYADGFLTDVSHVIMDRDPLYTHQVKTCFTSIGCTPKVLPARSPNLNAYIERFIGTVRREIGTAIIPLSTEHLRHTLAEHIVYYNHERNHQGLSDHRIPAPLHGRCSHATGPIRCRSRLGKTLNFYYREAV